MSEVRIRETESLESALRRFKRQCARAGVLAEVRKREHYEKPSVKRKKKAEAARKRKYLSEKWNPPTGGFLLYIILREWKPMSKCKITVLRKELYEDLQREYLENPTAGKCPYFEEGQEWLVENKDFFRMLNGQFCAEAWDCISRYVYAALQGGSIMRGWSGDERVMIACCNDGTRPVIFKLERIDD